VGMILPYTDKSWLLTNSLWTLQVDLVSDNNPEFGSYGKNPRGVNRALVLAVKPIIMWSMWCISQRLLLIRNGLQTEEGCGSTEWEDLSRSWIDASHTRNVEEDLLRIAWLISEIVTQLPTACKQVCMH
jgi:hypothetical protein